MKTRPAGARWLKPMTLALAVAATAAHATDASASVVHGSVTIAGKALEYDVVLPNGYDAKQAYPGVLAFSGGGQTVAGDQHTLEINFRDQAEKRGYIVVMPAAPGGVLFYNGSERLIPDFLRYIKSLYKIQGGRFRVAGRSNGGVSAFEVASLYPQDFLSITAFPGYLLFPTEQHIQALSHLCIHMFVGANDQLGFERPMRELAAQFRAHHMAVTYSVEPGQPHQIGTLMNAGSARLFDQFEQDAKGCVRN